MDTVDTPFWPDVYDFVKPDRTIPWRDLQHDIFRIVQTYDLGKGKFGPSVVLELEKKCGQIYFAWAPLAVVFALRQRKQTKFIFNLGLKASKTSDSFYYDFELY